MLILTCVPYVAYFCLRDDLGCVTVLTSIAWLISLALLTLPVLTVLALLTLLTLSALRNSLTHPSLLYLLELGCYLLSLLRLGS